MRAMYGTSSNTWNCSKPFYLDGRWGAVVLSYYEQYGNDSRIKAMGLVDTAPFPFSPADWNSHC